MRKDKRERVKMKADKARRAAISVANEKAMRAGVRFDESEVIPPVSLAPRAHLPGGMTVSLRGSKVGGKVKAKRCGRHSEKARMDGKLELPLGERVHQEQSQKAWRALFGIMD